MENKKKFFAAGAADEKIEVCLPHLLLVPRGMVAWLAERPRRPIKYLNELR